MKEDKFYRNLLSVMAVAVAIGVFYQVRSLLSPVCSALLVAYILYPLVLTASRIGIPKGMTIVVILASIVSIIVYMVSSLIPAVKHEVQVLSNPDRYRNVAHSRLVEIGKDLSSQLEEFGLIRDKWKEEEIIQEKNN